MLPLKHSAEHQHWESFLHSNSQRFVSTSFPLYINFVFLSKLLYILCLFTHNFTRLYLTRIVIIFPNFKSGAIWKTKLILISLEHRKKCLPFSHTSHTFQHSFYIKNFIAEAASTWIIIHIISLNIINDDRFHPQISETIS